MDEIYLQWRIETWGEGKSLFALKRMQKTATREKNHKYMVNSSHDYNNQRMIFEIPEVEVNNNPQISYSNGPSNTLSNVFSINLRGEITYC